MDAFLTNFQRELEDREALKPRQIPPPSVQVRDNRTRSHSFRTDDDTQKQPPVVPPGAAEPFNCCLYPESGYPSSDLPFSVYANYHQTGTYIFYDLAGVTGDCFADIVNANCADALASGFYYTQFFTIDEGTELSIIYAGDAGWNVLSAICPADGSPAFIETGPTFLGTCLIGTGNAFSPFQDTYTVDGTTVITAPCSAGAYGTPGQNCCQWLGGGFTLQYNGSGPNIYKWTLNGTVKTDPQSSPDGTYGAHTVSP